MKRLIVSEDASIDFFTTVLISGDSWITISAKRSEVVLGGSPSVVPTYSIFASNIDGEKIEFDTLSAESTDVEYTKNIFLPVFGYQYLGLEYKSGTATGTIEFYMNDSLV